MRDGLPIRTRAVMELTESRLNGPGSPISRGPFRPQTDGLLEVKDGAALGDRRRIDRHTEVLVDPLGGTPG